MLVNLDCMHICTHLDGIRNLWNSEKMMETKLNQIEGKNMQSDELITTRLTEIQIEGEEEEYLKDVWEN